VQRVRTCRLRVDVELELDPARAVGQLEDHPRLEVVRTVRAPRIVTVVVADEATVTRVFDVREDISAAVEAGQVQEDVPSSSTSLWRSSTSCRSSTKKAPLDAFFVWESRSRYLIRMKPSA
jgi:hypothetical protein